MAMQSKQPKTGKRKTKSSARCVNKQKNYFGLQFTSLKEGKQTLQQK